VMIKASTASGSDYALLAVTPGNGIAFQDDFNSSTSGGSYTFPNAWLKLTRSGTVITAYSSSDGTTWTEVGTASISMTDPVTIGLFNCAHNGGALNTATFANVSVTAGAALTPVPSPWADADVGSPAVAGSASYASGVFTVNGGGDDIWGSTDQFNYVSQPLTGDATIVAQVTSQSDTDAWAKAGVMIKASTASGSDYALLAVTPGNGIAFQDDFNSSTSGGSYSFPDAWLKLTRSGSTITAYSSPDGTTWTEVGTATISMTDPVTIGLFNCAHNGSALNTATFANVSVTASLQVSGRRGAGHSKGTKPGEHCC
jgi:regulation of enolase protein 1 (concanavalin A-like superfamily)